MTFDFAPDWRDTWSSAIDTAESTFRATPTAPPPLVSRAARAPAHPSHDQMATLVGELFAEGSLSFEQLCSLSNAPELADLLGDTVAAVVPSRRTDHGSR